MIAWDEASSDIGGRQSTNYKSTRSFCGAVRAPRDASHNSAPILAGLTPALGPSETLSGLHRTAARRRTVAKVPEWTNHPNEIDHAIMHGAEEAAGCAQQAAP